MVQRPTSTDRRRYGTSGYALLVLCVLALAAVVAQPASGGKDRVKEIDTRISVNSIAPLPTTQTTVTVTGEVDANRGCGRRRIVEFRYAEVSQEPLGTVRTGGDGAFALDLPRPRTRGSATLVTSVDTVKRRSRSKLVRCARDVNKLEIVLLPPVRPPR